MKERVPFIAEWESGELSVAALCRKYGVSRQTGHKWTRRYKATRTSIRCEIDLEFHFAIRGRPWRMS
ncbi:MAG: helix-turn-helix domain-containing protein [Planctomycetes bacterium]|nr:helix-turn-helix domain-containing protein [Planctomycetota bacterium]